MLELLNSEGPILLLSHGNKSVIEEFVLIHKKMSEELYISRKDLKLFLNGADTVSFPVSRVTYDYNEYPSDMKPDSSVLRSFVESFNIVLSKENWRWVAQWTDSFCNSENLNKRLSDTLQWIKNNVRPIIRGQELSKEIQFLVPKEIANVIAYSVGQIAYVKDVKFTTAEIAYEILCLIEEQMTTDEMWEVFRH